MWCAFEKLCKLNPGKFDVNKYFSEINPKIADFNKKNNNSKGNNENTTNFSLSPLHYQNEGNLNTTNNSIYSDNKNIKSVDRFNLIRQPINENENSKIKKDYENNYSLLNNNKIISSNLTPVMNKANSNDNYNHPGIKIRENKVSYFAESPANNIQLNLNKHISSYDFNSGNTSNFNNSADIRNYDFNAKIRPFNIYNSSKVNSENSDKDTKIVTKSFMEFENVSQLLLSYSEILTSLSLYNCQDAINIIKTLPYSHQKSGYVLSILGRCYFELTKYKESEKEYNEALKIEPARLEGLEYFSSCLWHLKDQYKLCSLANHALEQSHFCPETWIVVGNCYSLQKEHELAVKFFNRAIQLDNTMSYAYTLSGHEFVENESYSQAKSCYEQAVSYDDR